MHWGGGGDGGGVDGAGVGGGGRGSGGGGDDQAVASAFRILKVRLNLQVATSDPPRYVIPFFCWNTNMISEYFEADCPPKRRYS